MDKDLLELWGRTLLEMARMTEGTQSFYKMFHDGFAKKEQDSDAAQEQFIALCRKIFGKDGIETFNSTMKEFYENVGVVPRAEHHALQAKYMDLKKKVRELEDKISRLNKKMKSETGISDDLMEQWTETTQKYADVNQQMFEAFSKFFK